MRAERRRREANSQIIPRVCTIDRLCARNTNFSTLPPPPTVSPLTRRLFRPTTAKTVQGIPRRRRQVPRGEHRVPLRRQAAFARHGDHEVVPELQALKLPGWGTMCTRERSSRG